MRSENHSYLTVEMRQMKATQQQSFVYFRNYRFNVEESLLYGLGFRQGQHIDFSEFNEILSCKLLSIAGEFKLVGKMIKNDTLETSGFRLEVDAIRLARKSVKKRVIN